MPTGVLYFLVLPVVLTLSTIVNYLAEKELKKHPFQVVILSAVAYAVAWLILTNQWISSYFWPELLGVAAVMALSSVIFIAPLITYLAVLITFQCSPKEALRFWGRWIVLILALLLLLTFIATGVG
jgi:hypothetical protein